MNHAERACLSDDDDLVIALRNDIADRVGDARFKVYPGTSDPVHNAVLRAIDDVTYVAEMHAEDL